MNIDSFTSFLIEMSFIIFPWYIPLARLSIELNGSGKNRYSYLIFFFFWPFCLSRAAPMAYGSSQTRGLIGGVAASLH